VTRVHRHLIGAAATLVCGAGLAACSSATITPSSFSVTPTTTKGVTLSTERSPVGRVLATPGGRTLYDFTPDTPTSSACTKGLCVRLWPPLITTTAAPKVGRGLEQSLVSTIRRKNGQLQITYGGHPLYTWAGDTTPGMITGQALLNVGGYWYVIRPTGQQVTSAFRVTRTSIHGH
jgi:predicted lipoprotein with Yx(FWY)xxD motif